MTNSDRAAIFIPDLGGGGAERMMANLACGLSQAGLDVDLVLMHAEGPYLDNLPEHVRVIELNASRIALSPLPLYRYLRRERPKVLLSALLHANVAALLAGLVARSPRMVISERNTISVDRTNISSPTIRVARFLAKLLYREADAIIAVSHGVARDLSDFTGIPLERIDVVNNPVVTPRLLAQAGQPASHPWLAKKDCPVILGVGRLAPQKDFTTLLVAFAQVRRTRPLRLIILGEGEEREALQTLAEELGVGVDTDFPGFAENPYAYMAAADLFVLSSRWEGSPNALVEAMACGTPVVSTDCPSGPQEILAGGTYGPLVPVGDPDRLADAISFVLEDPTPARLLKQRASEYSVERSTEGYLDVLFRGLR